MVLLVFSNGSCIACREVLRQQLFLLNTNLNNAIVRTRDECVQVWELQLVGVQQGKVYSLQDLQASYKAAAKVTMFDSRLLSAHGQSDSQSLSGAALAPAGVMHTVTECLSRVLHLVIAQPAFEAVLAPAT